MSKKLEETLNLRSSDEIELEANLEEITSEDLEYIEETEEIKIHSKEMDEIYDTAMKAHKEILDLGYTVDTKYSGNILSTSATFLDLAIKASKSKVENKLKRIKMDMDVELKVEKTKAKEAIDGNEIIMDEDDVDVELLSRNDVLRKVHEIMNGTVQQLGNEDEE